MGKEGYGKRKRHRELERGIERREDLGGERLNMLNMSACPRTIKLFMYDKKVFEG